MRKSVRLVGLSHEYVLRCTVQRMQRKLLNLQLVEFTALILNTGCETPTCYINTSSHQINISELINITRYSLM
jgi:hypothetical protein